jgi:hypothetical protein
MDKLFATSDVCELCFSERIKKYIDKYHKYKDDSSFKKVVVRVKKESTFPCIKLPCKNQSYDNVEYHSFCEKHLYKMIDAIKEYEDDSHDR